MMSSLRFLMDVRLPWSAIKSLTSFTVLVKRRLALPLSTLSVCGSLVSKSSSSSGASAIFYDQGKEGVFGARKISYEQCRGVRDCVVYRRSQMDKIVYVYKRNGP